MKKTILITTMLLGGLSVAQAAEITTDTLANILALPNATGTIAGTTFAFNYPLNGVPEYFSGPWAGESTWGPASNITFTPDASQSDNPGFTLSGDFHASYGQLYDISLAYFNVTALSGMNIDSVSVDIGNPGPAGTPDYQNNASLNSCYAFQSAPSATCAQPSYLLGNTATFGIDLRVWNYSSSATIGFDSATFHFHESPVSTVPVPAAAWLFGSGLLGLIGIARRKVA